MADFKKLIVWQKAHAMSLAVDTVAADIRGIQYSELRKQLVRAAASVPTNIVEGRAQATEREFARFLRYSIASASETEYHILSAKDKGVITDSDYDILTDQVVEVRKMLHGLVDRLTGAITTQQRPPKPEAAVKDLPK